MRSTPTFINLQKSTGFAILDPDSRTIGAVRKRNGADANAQASKSAMVDIGALLNDTCSALIESPACADRMALTKTILDDCLVRAHCAGSIVLIVSEAVRNAARYAHPTSVPGRISLDCRRNQKGGIRIEVVDDGVGLPEGFDPSAHGNVGFQLMRGQAEKLGASLTFESASLGLCVVLHVPPPLCSAMNDITGNGDGSLGLLGDTQQSRKILQALPGAIYTTDAAGRITFYNEAAATLWGCRPELGKSEFCGSWKLFWPDGKPMPHDECPMALSLRQKRPIRGATAVAERPDGTRVTFIPYPTPLFDDSGKLIGGVNMLVDITEIVTERRSAQERQNLILDEMKHRIRNTLATTQAIAMETWRSATRDERAAFSARLRALANSHDLLTSENWDRVAVRDVVSRALGAFAETHPDRFDTDGPDRPINANKALLLTMALHELATNAVKYGALSNSSGRVRVAWQFPQDDNTRMRLTWQETGGPAVVPPKSKGFGSSLIERAFKDQMDGAHIEFAPRGVVCTLELSL